MVLKGIKVLCLLQWCLSVVFGFSLSKSLQHSHRIAKECIVSSSELSALYDIFTSCQGENWLWSTATGAYWNFTVPDPNPCSPVWQGVTCDLVTVSDCGITALDLNKFNLNGTIPESISNLSYLEVLILTDNNLYGSIPESIGKLKALQELEIDRNSLTGTIPMSIGNLTSATILYLQENDLHGPIPGGITNCVNLKEIYLSFNRLTGSVPEDIGSLPDLLLFKAEDNHLNGTIPTSIGDCSHLEDFFLSGNAITGTIPSGVFNSTRLYELELSNNRLNGTIPSNLINCARMEVLSLNGNYLTGTIPDTLDLTLVELLSLDMNYLNGTIPLSLGNCSKLSEIYIGYNELTGKIPENVANLPLLDFYAEFNFLTGPIPPSLLNNPGRVMSMIINNNYLTGTLPPINLPHALEISLNNNYLEGSLNDSLCASENVELLTINDNMLTGTLPDCYFVILFTAYVDNNAFTGTLPSNFISNESTAIYLSYNYFTGEFPVQFSELTSMQSMEVNNNLFSGTLPPILPAFEYLYVQSNMLTFSLPSLNTTFTYQLKYVDISDNSIQGSLTPEFFSTAGSLVSFAASSNCIKGSIPSQICALSNLLYLGLDGVSTATSCRTSIFPNVNSVNSFTIKNQIVGGIPECLFGMSTLQTLHLSGNNIEWSFPVSFELSESLSTLYLSHNRISGTIPAEFQQRQWKTLDLSYNKLGGHLHSDILLAKNNSLVLQVNRLSGEIPSVMKDFTAINILTGNLFDCNFDRDSLPVNDKAEKVYQCGSNSFNQAGVVWCACFVAIMGSFALLHSLWKWQVKSITEWMTKNADWYCSILQQFDPDSEKNLSSFLQFLLSCRNSVLLVTLLSIVVFLPVYGALKVYYKTAEYQYAWTVSAAYLSGTTPAMVLLVFYVLFIVACFLIWFYLCKKIGLTSSNRIRTRKGMQWMVMSVIVLFNCAAMSVINGGYVAVLLSCTTEAIAFTQIAMALLKLLWNDFVIRGMVLVSRRVLRSEDSENEDTLGQREMPFLTFMILFNTIIAPCLATAAVDSNCFYNVFVAPSAVTSQFPIVTASCDLYGCSNVTTTTYIEVSYDPPFIYSYQCSSSILTNYAAVYLFMYLILAFLKPAVLCLLVWMQRLLPKESCAFLAINGTLYSLLRPEEFQKETEIVFFNRERFILRTVAKLTVLLTFGVVFPPLTVVVGVAFVTETYVNIVIIGRYLVSCTHPVVYRQSKDKLVKETQGCMELLLDPLSKLVVPFAAFFYSFFVFDVYGDAVGFKKAIWAPALLAAFPLLLWVGMALFNYFKRRTHQRGRDESMAEVENEMNVMM